MGLLFSLLSALAYAFDTTLMAKHYRHTDIFLALGLRGAAIALSGTVLLCLTPWQAFSELPDFMPYLVLAGLTGAIANWGYAQSTQFFPVGIANASVMALQVITMSFFGMIFFKEVLDVPSSVMVILIVVLNIYMALQLYDSSFEFKKPLWAGGLFLLINGILQSVSFILLAQSARELDPLLSAYVWEIFIGLFCLLAAFSFRTKKVSLPEPATFLSILWRSFPTVPAVACYAYATTVAPVAIVQAVFSSVALFAALIGGWLYKEHLKYQQIAALFVLVALIAVLKYIN